MRCVAAELLQLGSGGVESLVRAAGVAAALAPSLSRRVSSHGGRFAGAGAYAPQNGIFAFLASVTHDVTHDE